MYALSGYLIFRCDVEDKCGLAEPTTVEAMPGGDFSTRAGLLELREVMCVPFDTVEETEADLVDDSRLLELLLRLGGEHLSCWAPVQLESAESTGDCACLCDRYCSRCLRASSSCFLLHSASDCSLALVRLLHLFSIPVGPSEPAEEADPERLLNGDVGDRSGVADRVLAGPVLDGDLTTHAELVRLCELIREQFDTAEEADATEKTDTAEEAEYDLVVFLTVIMRSPELSLLDLDVERPLGSALIELENDELRG